MTSFSGLGFLTIAIGARRYRQQAEILSLSLRRNMPDMPIAIVTDNDDMQPFADVLIPVDRSMPIATAQKLLLDQYSPFEETLFIDSDCIAARPFHDELAGIRRYSFTPILERLTPIDGQDPYVSDLRAALDKIGGQAFPKFNGGVYYFDKSDLSKQVFTLAREYFRNYRDYGLIPFDRGGPGDETVIALALSKLEQLDLYKDGGRLMRTPTGMTGRLSIDPLGGGSSFNRPEGLVTPAIVHFAGHYLLMPEYRLAEAALRLGVPPKDLALSIKLHASGASAYSKFSRFMQYRVDGVKKRINQLVK